MTLRASRSWWLVVGALGMAFGGAISTGCGSDASAKPPVSSSSSGDPGTSSGEPEAGSDASAPDGASTSSSSGAAPGLVTVTNESVVVDGTKRTYTLVVPKSYDAAKKYPLVLELHGNGGDGSSFHQFYPFEEASKDAAILAYPTAIDSDWNLFDPPPGNRDIRFMQVLVDALATKYSVDTGRVFGDGYSNGAFFLNQVACRVGFFKALGNSAGGAPYDDSNGTTACAAVAKMPIVVMHGDKDFGVGPDSGQGTATYWAKVNGCAGPLSASTPAPCKAYDGCPANAQVHYCLVAGLGHVPWIQAAATAWAFFQAQP